MCVIISQPHKAHLDKTRAQRLWDSNPDGGGFAHINNGEIEIQKFMTFKQFWSQFEQARSSGQNPDFILHMRIATHGTVDLANVHPFRVDEHTVMAHNGIIHEATDYNDGRSDTKVFVDEVLPKLPEDWLDDPMFTSMVENWIGWSRLAFLTTNPALKKNLYILNKVSGIEKDGMWFSNDKGVNPPIKTTTNRYTSHWSERKEVMDWDDWPYPREQAIIKPGKGFGEQAISVQRDILTSNRKQTWLYKPIAWSATDDWSCFGCDEDLELPSGECRCWFKICLDCEQFAAECDCETGWSNNLILTTVATDNLIERASLKLGG